MSDRGARCSWSMRKIYDSAVGGHYAHAEGVMKKPMTTACNDCIMVPNRWIVGRICGWFGQYRSVRKDHESHTAMAAARLSVARIPIMVPRIADKVSLKHAFRIMCFVTCLYTMAISIANAAQPLSSWTFNDADRPVKAVAIGDSIAAYPLGSFVAFLQAACPRLEVVNLAKPMLGAEAIRERFIHQVLHNPHINLSDEQEVWMIYQGGLNSVEEPTMTNHHIRWTFVDAHRAGLQVMGISLLPWGSEHDRRWREINGLKTWYHTRQVVDFVMGRLSPTDALGPYATT